MTKPTTPRILTFRLKGKWWHQINDGTKPTELRLATDYWRKLIVDREYDEVHLWLGYPPKTETKKLIRCKWNGYELQTITHEEFGPDPVEVLAVDVTRKLESPTK